MLESGESSARAAGGLSPSCALISPGTALGTHTEFLMGEIESEATVNWELFSTSAEVDLMSTFPSFENNVFQYYLLQTVSIRK